MILFLDHTHRTVLERRHPNLGRLVLPRRWSLVRETAEAGIPWAMDNDAFGGLTPAREAMFERCLEAAQGVPGCRFVAVPDVVADHVATLYQWEAWAPRVLRYGLPAAFVLQDGIGGPDDVPWGSCDAVFIGGTTEFKVGPLAAQIVAEAKRRGRWVHMGRVNSGVRIAYAMSVGCDSVDGTGFSRFLDRDLPKGVAWASAPPQLRLVP